MSDSLFPFTASNGVSELERFTSAALDSCPVGTRLVAFRDGDDAPAVFIRRLSGFGNPYWADLINMHGSHLLSSDLVAMRFDRVHFITPEEAS